MESYHEAYRRYRSRVHPNMLNKFSDRLTELKKNLKNFPDQPTRSKAAYALVRKELLKYQLNGDLVSHLDELDRQNKHEQIVKFLD